MKVLSVNVGQPREVPSGQKIVLTSIFKSPVQGRIAVRDNNLAGDRQSDLRVHGGTWKAIYAYPFEHYAFWQEQLGVDLTWGNFGENLTTDGLLEADLHVGDRLRIGSAELIVTQPRMPCFKLGIRFGDPEMVKRFLASRRSGFYFAVATEGEIEAGDTIELMAQHEARVTIPEILEMYVGGEVDAGRLQQAIDLPALSDAWREDLRKRLP
jgi:MOSC domain-containing protein YiiM